ncbi:MAG: hypothetical protein IID41_13015 [Planctomycetes bacterium]|nr:hypothetical protein [Planctomycetota bacterium]
MSLFQFTPPVETHHNNLDIIRTPAAGKIGGWIVTTTMHGLPIHFHGRSIPCSQTDDCPVCARGNKPRWTGYLGIWLPAWIKPKMLELPTGAAEQVAGYANTHGRILHKAITVWRPKKVANGPVEVYLSGKDIDGIMMPEEPDIQAALCVLWGLKKDDIEGSLVDRMKSFDRYALQGQRGNGSK